MDRFQQYAIAWENIILKTGRKETVVFESNSMAYTEELIMCNARRNLMVLIYGGLEGHKKIKPIEELDKEDKEKMWAFIKEVCAGKTNDKKRMIEIAKVFYTLEYFINERL